MTQTTLYRGLSLNGEWYVGNLTILNKDIDTVRKKGYYISNSVGMPFAYSVRPETVGQCTGLKDKNGTDIYHGDILREDSYGIFEVVWEQSQCKISLDWKRTSPTTQYPGWNRGIKMEIIGNIYQNIELIHS